MHRCFPAYTSASVARHTHTWIHMKYYIHVVRSLSQIHIQCILIFARKSKPQATQHKQLSCLVSLTGSVDRSIGWLAASQIQSTSSSCRFEYHAHMVQYTWLTNHWLVRVVRIVDNIESRRPRPRAAHRPTGQVVHAYNFCLACLLVLQIAQICLWFYMCVWWSHMAHDTAQSRQYVLGVVNATAAGG